MGCSLFSGSPLQPFPAGYIDSAFAVPDGSALYFLHSVVSTLQILEQDLNAKPVTPHLTGHRAQEGEYWWNTDLYVSLRNPEGTWGEPRNLGPEINTEHMESSPWINDRRTLLIFTRESVADPSFSGSFISSRNSPEDPWGMPERLPGSLGDYAGTGFMDFHLVPSGNLYFWSEFLDGNGTLYWAESTGPRRWAEPERMPGIFQSDLHETQPWINDRETLFCFNRRGDDANTQLLCASRKDPAAEWEPPDAVPIEGIADENGYSVWGEPSFLDDGMLFLVRFNTGYPKWKSEILWAEKTGNGGYGTPREIVFVY